MQSNKQSQNSKKLFEAVENRDVHQVYEMLKWGDFTSVEVNQRLEDGSTALLQACISDNHSMAEIVKVLLTYPYIDASIPTYAGETTLMRAVQSYNVPVIRMLLARPDIQVNAQQIEDGTTALMWAVDDACLPVQLLLDHSDIDVTLKDWEGRTALDHAHTEEMRTLLRACLNALPMQSWLATRLDGSGYDAATIRHCEQRLVSQEGFLNEADFADCAPGIEFNRAYLNNIGIHGLGLQKHLLKLQAELHEKKKKAEK